MEESWLIVVTAAVTGTFALLGAGIPKIADAVKDRSERKARREDKRASAFAHLRRLYLASRDLLESPTEPIWVNLVAAAADCIPYTEPDSEARSVLIEIIGRRHVDVETFIAAVPA